MTTAQLRRLSDNDLCDYVLDYYGGITPERRPQGRLTHPGYVRAHDELRRRGLI